MSDLNDFDESQEQVVDAPETEEVTSEVIEETPNEEVAIPQPPEVNHQFAEFRKTTQAEIDRLAKETQQKEELLNLLFEDGYRGEVNPYTQKPIETIDDYLAWREEDRKQTLQKAGVTQEYLKQLIAEDPEVKALREENARRKTEDDRKKADDLKRYIGDEISKIQPMNQSIKSFDDLVKDTKDNRKFQALIAGGYSFSEAYAEVRKNPQRKPDDTKNHLQSLGGGNAGNVTEVTPEEMKQFQKFNPKVTKEEVIAWKKKNGGNK